MDFKNQAPSDNFEDRTDDSPAVTFLKNLQMKLNPVTAVRKVSQKINDKLIHDGIVKVPGADEFLARIDEEIRKRHAAERAHPPKGFVIDEQGNYIPVGNGLTPGEEEVILGRHKNKK